MNRRRGRPQRPTRRTVLLVTNGRVTEQTYLKLLRSHLRSPSTTVKVEWVNGEPDTVLAKLTSPNGDATGYDEVWLVLDEDGQDRCQFMARFSAAGPRDSAWHVVLSRPCFEAWLVAHYEQVRRYADQAQAQAHYRSAIPRTTPSKALPADFPIDQVDAACQRCRLPGEPLESIDSLPPLPGSGMPHLVRSLRSS